MERGERIPGGLCDKELLISDLRERVELSEAEMDRKITLGRRISRGYPPMSLTIHLLVHSTCTYQISIEYTT